MIGEGGEVGGWVRKKGRGVFEEVGEEFKGMENSDEV